MDVLAIQEDEFYLQPKKGSLLYSNTDILTQTKI